MKTTSAVLRRADLYPALYQSGVLTPHVYRYMAVPNNDRCAHISAGLWPDSTSSIEPCG